MRNLPVPNGPSDYDRMRSSLFAFVADGITNQALEDLTVIAQNPLEFEAGMNAMVELGDIIRDHNEKEPDDGTFDEEDILFWGTEDDDFDPPEDWFGEDGPFGPYD